MASSSVSIVFWWRAKKKKDKNKKESEEEPEVDGAPFGISVVGKKIYDGIGDGSC